MSRLVRGYVGEMTTDPRHAALTATSSLVLVASLAACGGGAKDTPSAASDGASDAGGQQKTLTVFAAASLTDVYEDINAEFEKAHPGVKVVMTNGGSNDLVTQISQGAPADVLATADTKNMDKAVEQRLIAGDPTPFATNELTIAVQPGNPKGIDSLGDLSNTDVQVVECAAEVPCGTVTDKVYEKAGVQVTPVSEENSVTDVLGKVTSGNADAGLVYTTDVKRSGGKAEAVAIPEAAEFTSTYPIAVVKDSKNADLAQQYVSYMIDAAAQKDLQDAGFGAP